MSYKNVSKIKPEPLTGLRRKLRSRQNVDTTLPPSVTPGNFSIISTLTNKSSWLPQESHCSPEDSALLLFSDSGKKKWQTENENNTLTKLQTHCLCGFRMCHTHPYSHECICESVCQTANLLTHSTGQPEKQLVKGHKALKTVKRV